MIAQEDYLVIHKLHALGYTITQIYTMIRPPQLKQAVGFYEAQARKMLSESGRARKVV